MLFGKLIGNIWATRKAESLNGYKLMIAEIIAGSKAGEEIIVADVIGAGIGDKVIITTGSSARKMMENDELPIDAAVVGIVDEDFKEK